MLSSGHAGFILAAYAFAGLVMVALVAGALLDRRAQRRALSALERDDRR